MEERLKQRLTGAAILVALVVLIVPEMFKGRPASRPAQLPAAPNGAPTRSVTLSLDEHGAGNSAVPATVVSDVPQGPPVPVSNPEAMRTSPPEVAGTSTAPAASGSSSAAPPSAPAPAEHIVAADRPVAAVHGSSTAPVHAQTPSAHAAAGGPASAKSGWTVQLGSFQQSDNAHRMAQKLAAKGIKTLVVGPDARGYYRVRTPEVADMASADSLRVRLLQQGFKGVIGTTP